MYFLAKTLIINNIKYRIYNDFVNVSALGSNDGLDTGPEAGASGTDEVLITVAPGLDDVDLEGNQIGILMCRCPSLCEVFEQTNVVRYSCSIHKSRIFFVVNIIEF